MNVKTCCTPHRSGDRTTHGTLSHATADEDITFDTVDIGGGTGLLGTDRPVMPADEEAPTRQVDIQPFRIMRAAVTNALFREFVAASGYKTDAERYGWSFVFDGDCARTSLQSTATGAPWWRAVKQASWQCIDGVTKNDTALDDHPVVHVSWNDARAFARWAGGRLPLEREWEYAARGGRADVMFPWGDAEPDDHQFTPCNIWQGDFPRNNTAQDGYAATAPVRTFEPNGYGLYNLCGNVWEWTAQSFKIRSRESAARAFGKQMRGTKVLKGGSFLCHRSYCYRYRIAARTASTPDSSTTHQGFRLVFDA